MGDSLNSATSRLTSNFSEITSTSVGQEKIMAEESWNNGFCGCFSVKGVGCVPCWCPNTCCCMPCMWASAMYQIKGKEAEYSYGKCCFCACCCPMCTFAKVYFDLSDHYKIKHTPVDAVLKFCLPFLSYFRILDTVLVKEQLHMINVNVAPDATGAPAMEDMGR